METRMDDTATRICSILRHKAETFADEENEDKHEMLEWSAACLIERQAAQIERMRTALVEAMRVLSEDRAALIECHTDHEGHIDDDGRSAAEVYDKALRMIDEAMGESNDR